MARGYLSISVRPTFAGLTGASGIVQEQNLDQPRGDMDRTKRDGETVERRARVQPCHKCLTRLTALAAEVRFSSLTG
jgi:hypothetical protein